MALAPVGTRGQMKAMASQEAIAQMKNGDAWTVETVRALYEHMRKCVNRGQLSDGKLHTAQHVRGDLVDETKAKKLESRWDEEKGKWMWSADQRRQSAAGGAPGAAAAASPAGDVPALRDKVDRLEMLQGLDAFQIEHLQEDMALTFERLADLEGLPTTVLQRPKKKQKRDVGLLSATGSGGTGSDVGYAFPLAGELTRSDFPAGTAVTLRSGADGAQPLVAHKLTADCGLVGVVTKDYYHLANTSSIRGYDTERGPDEQPDGVEFVAVCFFGIVPVDVSEGPVSHLGQLCVFDGGESGPVVRQRREADGGGGVELGIALEEVGAEGGSPLCLVTLPSTAASAGHSPAWKLSPKDIKETRALVDAAAGRLRRELEQLRVQQTATDARVDDLENRQDATTRSLETAVLDVAEADARQAEAHAKQKTEFYLQLKKRFQAAAALHLHAGDRVELRGLNKGNHNGSTGRIESYDEKKGRYWVVSFDGPESRGRFKPENLVKAPAASDDVSVEGGPGGEARSSGGSNSARSSLIEKASADLTGQRGALQVDSGSATPRAAPDHAWSLDRVLAETGATREQLLSVHANGHLEELLRDELRLTVLQRNTVLAELPSSASGSIETLQDLAAAEKDATVEKLVDLPDGQLLQLLEKHGVECMAAARIRASRDAWLCLKLGWHTSSMSGICDLGIMKRLNDQPLNKTSLLVAKLRVLLKCNSKRDDEAEALHLAIDYSMGHAAAYIVGKISWQVCCISVQSEMQQLAQAQEQRSFINALRLLAQHPAGTAIFIKPHLAQLIKKTLAGSCSYLLLVELLGPACVQEIASFVDRFDASSKEGKPFTSDPGALSPEQLMNYDEELAAAIKLSLEEEDAMSPGRAPGRSDGVADPLAPPLTSVAQEKTGGIIRGRGGDSQPEQRNSRKSESASASTGPAARDDSDYQSDGAADGATSPAAQTSPLQWSVSELTVWLRDSMELPAVADAAAGEKLDGATAIEMDTNAWKELGSTGVNAAKLVATLKRYMNRF
jgi:hypothetical protein